MDFKTIVYIFLAVSLFVILVILSKYNKLIKLQNKVKKAKANISIYLNKRFDLIPNLVECTKGYTKHEGSTLEEIVKLRNSYNNQKNLNINQVDQINNDLTKYLAVFENYPNLKANTQFLNLQSELSRLEDELQRARHVYNDVVTSYNVAIETVPSNIVALLFGFRKAELFKVDNYKEENVKLNFDK